MIHRRALIALLAAAPFAATAHHGYMKWDKENPVRIEGFISKEMDGYPHWEIEVFVTGDERWDVDLGNDIYLKKAGLRGDGSDFWLHRKVVVEGWRPQGDDALRILPTSIWLEGDDEEHVFEGMDEIN